MLKIVDRTKPLTFKPVQVDPAPIKTPTPIVENKSILQQYQEMAAAIKAKKKQPNLESNIPKKAPTLAPVPLKSFLEVANELKAKRLAIKNEITPIQIKPNGHFTCKNKDMVEFEVSPSIHAIEQFIKRYVYIEPYIKTLNYSEIVEYMKDIFNNSCGRISSKDYQYRNSKRKDGASALIWGESKFAFVIHPDAKLIVTFELIGSLRPLNKVLSIANKDAFASGEYSRLKTKANLRFPPKNKE